MHRQLSFGPGMASMAIVLALSIAACSEPIGPDTARIDGLEATLSLEPSTVQQHGSTDVTLTIRNTRPDTATVVSGCSLIAFIRLYRDGERVTFRGADSGCLPVSTSFQIPPGETLERRWTITAEDRLANAVVRGSYTVRTEFNVRGWDDLEQTLRVE